MSAACNDDTPPDTCHPQQQRQQQQQQQQQQPPKTEHSARAQLARNRTSFLSLLKASHILPPRPRMPALATQFSPCSVRCSPFHQHRWQHAASRVLLSQAVDAHCVRYVVGCSQHFGIVGNGQVTVAVEQGDAAVVQVSPTLTHP